MRLLDVHSVSDDRIPVFREIHEDGQGPPPRYAVLSHTWGKRQDNKEIVFDDIPSSETFAKFLDEATQLKQWQGVTTKKKAGFSKVTNACQVARGMGLNYIWIDSCCIDKSKSAELNESINSMYRWYKNSEHCIVYLEDLGPGDNLDQCIWFKRGWTLQELVAPSSATFYNSNWDFFGEKSDTGLCESLSHITGIDMACLQGFMEPASLSTAQKMSWATGRETSVPEDRAYSLMGIFDVNMALIYGEGGTKAFRRLQEEIVRVSSDLSILAWDPCSNANTGLDTFASKPDEFAAYKDMVPSYQSQHFTRTNKGLEMRTILWQVICEDGKERLMLAIGKQKNGKVDIGIILRKLGHNMYMRHGNMHPFSEDRITSSTRSSTFYLVSPHVNTGYDHVLGTSRNHAILISPDYLGTFYTGNPVPQYAWDCEDGLFFNNRHWGGSDWRAIELIDEAALLQSDRRFVVLFSLKDATPGCYLLRWREEMAVIFDRRHQTEITKLEELKHIIKRATNEVDVESTSARLTIRLVPTTTNENSSVVQFRMELLVRGFLPYYHDSPASESSMMNNRQSLTPCFARNSDVQTPPSGSQRKLRFLQRLGSGKGYESFTSTTNSQGRARHWLLGAPPDSVSASKMLSHFDGRLDSLKRPSSIPFGGIFGLQVQEQYAKTHEGSCNPQLLSGVSSKGLETLPKGIFDPDILDQPQAKTLPEKRVFSQFQETDVPLEGSSSVVLFAALNGGSITPYEYPSNKRRC